MPRTVSGPERTLSKAARVTHILTAEVKDVDGSWQDLRDLGPDGINVLVGGSISTTVDALVWSATVRVRLGADTEGASPLLAASLFNRDGVSAYAPLLNPGAQIRLYAHTLAPATAESDPTKRLMFLGRIDRSDFTSDPMTLTCRDLGGILLDTIVREDRTYGDKDAPVAAHLVMQQFLDDNADLLGGTAPTLEVPTAPTYVVTEFRQVGVSILDALNTLAMLFGWVVRYTWNASDDFVLTLYDPQRDRVIPSGGDYLIEPREYHEVDAAQLDIQGVRNRLKGWYTDGVTGEALSVEVSDSGSILTFGERFEQFGGPLLAGITDGNTMLLFLQYALADQAAPPFDHTVKAMFLHFPQLGDVPEFSGNAVHYDDPQQLAVVGIAHEFPDSGQGAATTALQCRGTPSGAYKRWLRFRGGPVFPLIPPAPELLFLLGELTQFGGTLDEVDGALWLGYRMPVGVDEIQVFAVLGNGQDLPVPDTTATTLALTLRRPDGDIGRVQQLGGREGGEIGEYVSMACLSTRPEMWKRVLFRGVRGGLTSKPTITASVNAIDPTPTTDDSLMTIASLDVVRSGSTNTVTVTPGTLDTSVGNDDNFVVIIRNEHILPPIFVQGSSAPVVFVDSGLDPSVSSTYVYDAFIWNGGQSGGRARAIAQPPTIVAPEFALGTPLAAVVGTVPKVQISWTGATPGADGVFVQASLDGLTGFRSVGFGNLASGTVYDDVTGPKLYRLVAYDTATSDQIAYSPWQYFNGLPTSVSNPAALPKFVNGTPKAVLTNVGSPLNPSFLAYLSVQWNCATPGAALIAVQSSPDNIAAYTDVTNGVSGSVAFGEWKSPNNAAAKTDAYYRLQARASDGTTVLATSAPIHYIPPS